MACWSLDSLFCFNDSGLLDYKHFSFLFVYAVVRSWGYTDCKIIKIFIVHSSHVKMPGHKREASGEHLFSYVLIFISYIFLRLNDLC